MINESSQHIREKFFAWAKEYGVDAASHEEWNKFLSVWNLLEAGIERLNGLVAMQAEFIGSLDAMRLHIDQVKRAQDIIEASSDTVSPYKREVQADARTNALQDVGAMIAVGATINELADYIASELRAKGDRLEQYNDEHR